jgi:hypothetical protein
MPSIHSPRTNRATWMYSTSSAESAAFPRARTSWIPHCPVCRDRSLLSKGACEALARECLVTTTSGPSTESPSAIQLTLFAEDFPVRTFRQQERGPGFVERKADYGQNCSGSFAKYCRAFLWKTVQCSLIPELELSPETWPRSGMMRNGTAYQLQPLAPLTSEIGRGLLPTPRKSRGFTNPTLGKSRNDCLPTKIIGKPILGMRPHPRFGEWMMGFAIGWTELNALAIPSSRKSRKPSVMAIMQHEKESA